jgi:hypothetical protein
MKKIILIFVLFLIGFSLKAQCPTENISLGSQEEIDAFVATYGTTCPDLPISLGVTYREDTDVSGLDFITSIQGDLLVGGENYGVAVEITGFENLTSITGSIIFGSTAYIHTISGFNNLQSIGGTFDLVHLYFDENVTPNYGNSLQLISGFASLETVGGDFLLYQSTGGITIDGFYNLENIAGSFKFADIGLSSITGFTALNRVEGDISFSCSRLNEEMVNTTNLFTALTSIGGDLRIFSGYCGYSNIGLDFLNNLASIEGELYLDKATLRSGLSGLQLIGGNLLLKGAEEFPTLTNLVSVGGDIDISGYGNVYPFGDVDTKVSLNYPNLTNIGGSLLITGTNFTEVDIEEINFDNLTTIGGDIMLLSGNTAPTNLPADPEGLIEFDKGAQIGTVNINSLNYVGGSVTINYLPRSVASYSLSMNALETIQGNLEFDEFAPYTTSFQVLHTVNGNFTVRDLELGLNTLEDATPSLHTVGNDLTIIYNQTLFSLNGMESLQNVGEEFRIQSNTGLGDCTALCNYVQNNTNYLFVNSLPCQTTAQSCTSYTIEGTIQQDFDFNGCTVDDFPFQNIEIVASDGINNYSTFANALGEYVITVPEGTYTVSTTPINQIDVLPISQNVTFAGNSSTETIDFCGVFNEMIDDVAISILPLNQPRPGFEARYTIVLENQGTTLQSGTIELAFDSTNLNFTSATLPPTAQSTNTLTWNYTDVVPSESVTIDVFFTVFTIPTTNLGDILNFTVTAPSTTDVNPDNNQSSISQTVIGSYDPNDKRVLEGEHVLIEDIDEYLTYIIRFQNEGTASAINVRIVDFMSDLIDWTTFQPIDASHAYSIGLVTGEDPQLEFFFDNINLPDSTTDEPNSHGYVAFRVKPKATVQVGDIIDNRAGIYFDFNPPIITNKTETRIVEDTDGDGIFNYQDNCPNTSNVDQADLDNDGIGDVCDDDIDNDGILNTDDNCPLVASANQDDNDEDGLGDICDDDDDNDTILDVDDNCPLVANDDQNDNDMDGIGDACDDDDDNDGVLDEDDICPFTANPNQEDFDQDGIGDLCDDDDDNDGILDVDDDCPYYSGTSVDGCPFTLPVDNYIIQTVSETCASLDNAMIDIKAIANHNYEAALTRNGTAINLPTNTFIDDLLIENLDAGTYELCISITAENYEQCFTVEIGEPAELNANSALSRSNEYSIDLIGATMYTIFINEEEFTISAPTENTEVTFTKQLTQPINTVEVQTEKVCQGKYIETVKTNSNAAFIMLPNPSSNEIFVSLLNAENITDATVNIYDVSGREVMLKTLKTPVHHQKITIQNLQTGIYFVQLTSDEGTFTQKLIKK